MIRSNGRYFDFNGDIEMEKRVKLFEELDETLGDFAYEFELPRTGNNFSMFGFPSPDSVKSIYKSVPAEIVDDDGISIYTGQIKLERTDDTIIYCSFFSGNYNWITLLSGPLTGDESDLDFSDLDIELTEANIANTWDNEDGVIFPVIDTGALVTRSAPSIMIEDFSGCIYIKTVFKKIFQKAGIKLQGDFINSPFYDSVVLSRNTKSKEDIDDRTSYVQLGSDQNFSVPATSSTTTKILYDDDSTFPYFDGKQDNFDTVNNQYVADVKMRGKIEVALSELTIIGGSISDQRYLRVFINGVVRFSKFIEFSDDPPPLSAEVVLEAGDVVDVRFLIITAAGGADVTIHEGATFKFTPSYVYFTAGSSLLPRWTKGQFVNNILSLLCCVCDYEPISKTLTVDLFENIKTKSPIDLSDNLHVYQFDYQQFVSDFSQKNTLSYQEAADEEVKGYNISAFIKYGDGEINIDNDFIPRSGEILASEFSAPISYINGAFSASLEKISFIEVNDGDTNEFTSITNASGQARFNVPDDSIYEQGALVRISESSDKSYNGEFVINAVGGGSNYITLVGVNFETNATGKITKLLHGVVNDDSVYLFWQTKYRIDSVIRYSRLENYFINLNQYPNVAYAYFNLLNTGRPINDDYKQSLSFGVVKNPLFYQKTIIDTFWNTVGRVLNDPVKVYAYGNLTRGLFMSITPLRPIRITDVSTDNLYYLNLMSGYKNSYQPCNVELIKLS